MDLLKLDLPVGCRVCVFEKLNNCFLIIELDSLVPKPVQVTRAIGN